MLTGARRDEVGSLNWAEIEDALWTLPRARSKNGQPHEVSLGPLAMAQLPPRRAGRLLVFGERAGGFSGWSRSKERLDNRILALASQGFHDRYGREARQDEASILPWTLHDLRRTLSTWLSETGSEPHVVEAVLNHASGAAKRGVAGVYNKANYREPKRAALARWEGHLCKLMDMTEPAPPSGVVPLASAS
jgi:integrase